MKGRINFTDILIDTTEIPQSDLNIDIRTRTNLFAWNGQFSPQFVEAELKKYSKPNYFVIDPFLGSGTVLYECARKGLRAYGTELNVSAFYMAKICELCILNITDRWSLLFDIDAIINNVLNTSEFIPSLKKIINSATDSKIANILSTLIVLLDIYNNEASANLITDKWSKLREIIIALPYSQNTITVDNGDARCLAIPDDSADMLLTSPPYINVFNYHQKYRASVEALGYNVLSIAKSEFGSNRKHRSNRLYTVIQYCIDIALSLKEANRVCKENARMIYVVGRESTVLGYSFCNSELVYNLGSRIFGFDLLLRQERVFKNRYGQMIYEDILHFNNKKTTKLTDNDIILKARSIAIESLKSKLSQDNKNLELLNDAILKADNIIQSEMHYE